MSVGTNGSYIFCKRVDMNQPYLRMVVDCPLSDGASFELEISDSTQFSGWEGQAHTDTLLR
jgi:hypothetical protein